MNKLRDYLTRPRNAVVFGQKARLLAVLAAPAAVALVILFFAPRRIAQLDLAREQTAIAWLLVGAAVLACGAQAALSLAALHLMNTRWAIAGGVSVGIFFPAGILSLCWLSFNPAQLLAWILLTLIACFLANTICMGMALWSEQRRKSTAPAAASVGSP